MTTVSHYGNDLELFYLNQGRIHDNTDLQLSDDVSAEEIVSECWKKYVKNMDNPIAV